MYQFIDTLHEECMISPSDIAELERKYDIRVPTTLKEFYLKYNAAEISLCRFHSKDLQDEMFEIHTIYPIKYTPYENGVILEKVIWGDRMDGFIPPNLIPFAEDRGGNRYYCDENSEIVYFIPSDDIDNPVLVSENVLDFFNNIKKF